MNSRTLFALLFSVLALSVFGAATTPAPVLATFVNASGVAANGSAYQTGQYLSFNISWNDGNDTIIISVDGVNTTLSGAANFSTTRLAAGNHGVQWFANNTDGGSNFSINFTFALAKATPILTTHLNASAANREYHSGQNVNFTAFSITTGYSTNVSLYRNGSYVQSSTTLPISNTSVEGIAGNTVNWTAAFLGDQNYTSGVSTLLITNIRFNLNISFNSTQSSLTTFPVNGTAYSTGQYISFNASLNTGAAGTIDTVIYTLNGTNITVSGGANLSRTTLRVGQYNWTVFVNDSFGNANQSATYTFNLSIANPAPVLTINGGQADLAGTRGTTFTYSLSSAGKGYTDSATLFRNSVNLSTSTSTITQSFDEGLGTYNISAFVFGDENYTSGITTYTLTVTTSTTTTGGTSSGASCSGTACAGSTTTATATPAATVAATAAASAAPSAAPGGSSTAGTPTASAGSAATATPAATVEATPQPAQASLTITPPATVTVGETATITVTTSSGSTAAFVSVLVTAPDGTSQTVTTDADGRATFVPSQSGSYGFGLASGSSQTATTTGTMTAQTPEQALAATQAAAKTAGDNTALLIVVVLVVLAGIGYWAMNRHPKGL